MTGISDDRRRRRLYQAAAVGLYLGLSAVVLWQALRLNDGTLVYLLDDAAIHMELAETMLSGGYGVNPGEFASPSSSILYPFLLALAFLLGADTWGPLVVNLAAGSAAAWLIAGFVARRTGDLATGFAAGFAWALLPVWLLYTNITGLTFTGMEHVLHILASSAVAIGLLRLRPEQATPPWLILAIVAVPMLRFEGFALAGLTILALVLLGRVRAAFVAAIAIVVLTASYAALMSSLGLTVLPSSVMAKSGLTAAVAEGHGGILPRIMARFMLNLRFFEGQALLVAIALVTLIVAVFARSRRDILAGLVVLGAASAHLLLGRNDSWSRYELYAFVLLFLAAVHFLGPRIEARRSAPGAILLGLTMLAASINVIPRLILTPAGMNSIYLQQYQMGRFAREVFPRPVAINDLGYVTFRNDVPVLDLMGLGSEPARKMRAAGATPERTRALTEAAGVDYAMVYDVWLKVSLPPEWCAVARMTSPHVSNADDEVTFYAVRPGVEPDLRAALEAFAQDLPEGTSLAFLDCAG